MKEFFEGIWTSITEKGDTLFFAVIAIIIGMIVIKLMMSLVRKMLGRTKIEKVTAKFIGTAIKFVLSIILVYIVWDILGIPSTLFVALTSVSGVAISLALQGILSNCASGIIQLGAKRFKAGDYLKIEDVEGTVIEVDFISIKLSTPDNKIIYVPNSKATTENMINFSAATTRRVDLIISVAYGSKVEDMKSLLSEIILEDKRILIDPSPVIRLSQMAESSLNFVCRCHVLSADYWDVYYDLTEKIYSTLCERGIEIPYRKMDVNITSYESKAK